MTPEALFAGVRHEPGAVWLDGGDTGWSIVAWRPTSLVTAGAGWPVVGRGMLRPAPRGPAPFVGGVIGYIGYGAGHHVAPVPASAPTPEPEVWLARYAGALCFHHASGAWHATGDRSLDDLAQAVDLAPPPPPPHPRRLPGWTLDDWAPRIAQILDWLHDGDCYQINLTRAERLEGVGDAFAAYRRLRLSAAPWGAFLQLSPHLAVLCNSPEQFLVADGRHVKADPIKGTRPRSANPDDDAAARDALLRSPKDLAELTMIVDLVRNDLGSVAAVGTVRAGERTVTGHRNVWHTSQPVSATLRDGLDVWDALAANFPPGSVTGAPKVRACQRIAELEATPRGVYCGTIGYASDCGQSAWNVAIRTAVCHGEAARFHVGGGIVVASAAGDEWKETQDKARELARAFGL